MGLALRQKRNVAPPLHLKLTTFAELGSAYATNDEKADYKDIGKSPMFCRRK